MLSTRQRDVPSRSETRPSVADTPTCSASSKTASAAVSQITYLYDQRQSAIAELARLQTTVQAVVEEMARSPLGRPAPGVAVAAASPAATDGTPTLPSEDDTRLRPDRVLGRSDAPVPAGPPDQAGGAAYRAGERAGRHSMSSDAELPPGYERE